MLNFIVTLLWIVGGVFVLTVILCLAVPSWRKKSWKYLGENAPRLRKVIWTHQSWAIWIPLCVVGAMSLVLFGLEFLNHTPTTVSTSNNEFMMLLGLAAVVFGLTRLYEMFRSRVQEEDLGHAEDKPEGNTPTTTNKKPLYSRMWNGIRGAPIWGFLWIPEIRYLWITALLIFTVVYVPMMFLLPEAWDNIRGKPKIFWGFTLGLLFVLWFAIAFHGKKWGKWVATVLAAVVGLGLFTQVQQTLLYKEWRASNPTPVASATVVVAKVELPRGTLMMEAGREPNLIEKTGWPEEHILEARNVVIDEFGLPAQFDIWDERIGKCGEFRWSKYTKKGTYCLQFPTEKGEWLLTPTGPPDEYEGWCFFVKKGEKLKVPVKFFVER
ncbi:MAG: hypothetical protein AAB534_00600 [Patescibacteria group bacterium]